jgi:hypothetical protein
MTASTNLTSLRLKVGHGDPLDRVDEAFLMKLHAVMERAFMVGIPAQNIEQADAVNALHDCMYGEPTLDVAVQLAPFDAPPVEADPEPVAVEDEGAAPA